MGRCQQNLSTSIAARKLTSAAERSSTFAGAAAVRIAWGVAALDDLAHVLQHHVAARLLRKAIAHLLGAPWKGASSQWVRIPRSNCRFRLVAARAIYGGNDVDRSTLVSKGRLGRFSDHTGRSESER